MEEMFQKEREIDWQQLRDMKECHSLRLQNLASHFFTQI